MRPLNEEETKTFFTKLANYIGRNIRFLIDRPDGEFCFRVHKDRIYYLSENLMKQANCVDREHLVSCFANTPCLCAYVCVRKCVLCVCRPLVSVYWRCSSILVRLLSRAFIHRLCRCSQMSLVPVSSLAFTWSICFMHSQVGMGTCFGKFTKTGKCRLNVTCLEYIAQFAKVRICI